MFDLHTPPPPVKIQTVTLDQNPDRAEVRRKLFLHQLLKIDYWLQCLLPSVAPPVCALTSGFNVPLSVRLLLGFDLGGCDHIYSRELLLAAATLRLDYSLCCLVI